MLNTFKCYTTVRSGFSYGLSPLSRRDDKPYKVKEFKEETLQYHEFG